MSKFQTKNWKGAAALLGAASVLLTACGASSSSESTTTVTTTAEATTATESTTAETTAATKASTTASTEAATTAASEASTVTTTEATTEASTETTTEATTEASTEATSSPIVDGEIQYSDDLVSTFYGDDAVMNICVLGDSQFGNFRGYDGLAYLISQYCHANVWNLGIGGATAAVPDSNGTDKDTWASVCGVGVAYALTDQVSSDFLADDFPYQKYLIDTIDLSNIDVFIVEYGINDYQDNINIDGNTNERSYRNAETLIGRTLHDTCPDAKIIFCGSTYAQFFDGDTYLGDINTYANSLGYYLINYNEALSNQVSNTLTNEANNVYSYFNAYELVNINSTNATETLQDDRIHMNSEGRSRYAQVLSRVIIRDMGYTIGEGVDPSTVEWWTTKSE